MSIPERPITVLTATLDVSVQYKGEFLNNTTVEFFLPIGGFNTGVIPLGDHGRRCIVVSQTTAELTLRLSRTAQAPQDDTSRYPVLAGDHAFGPITGNARVLIVVAEPAK